ncbi:MAG: EamA family transporter, partial [Actinomycetales bacterium]
MPRRDQALAVVVAVIWGCNFVAIHAGLTEVPPFLFLAIRFVLVAFPLVLFVPRPKASWQAVVAV